MKGLIGMGSRHDRLYYFKEPSSVKVVKVNKDDSSFSLWNYKIRHPSEKVVKYLPLTSSSKDYLNKSYEICFRAKHHRDSFPVSEHTNTQIF